MKRSTRAGRNGAPRRGTYACEYSATLRGHLHSSRPPIGCKWKPLGPQGIRNGAQSCIPINAACELHYAFSSGEDLAGSWSHAEKRRQPCKQNIIKSSGFLETQVEVNEFCLLVRFTFKISQAEALVQGGCDYPLL